METTNFSELYEGKVKTIKCKNCGADIDVHAKFCTFCGTTNEIGQEEDYMNRLETIEDNLEEMGDYAQEHYEKEKKSTFKKLRIPLIIVLILVGIFIALRIFVFGALTGYGAKKAIKWQTENYPIMDEMYENGEFEELAAFVDDVLSKPNFKSTAIYNWEHFQFVMAYDHYRALKAAPGKLAEYPDSEYTLYYCFYDSLCLLYENWDGMLKTGMINKKDYNNILEYQVFAADFLNDHFGIEDPSELGHRCAMDPPGEGIDFIKVKDESKKYTYRP